MALESKMINTIKNSKVLIKVDYNIPPNLKNIERINSTIPLIKQLLKQGNTIILLTHWGKIIREREDAFAWTEEKSTKKLVEPINRALKEFNIDQECKYMDQFGKKDKDKFNNFVQAKNKMEKSQNRIFLLENTRFHQYEKSGSRPNRASLARKYAMFADYYINEAFSLSHRREATNTYLQQYFELSGQSFNGPVFEKEKCTLRKIKETPELPLVLIMGGSKLETKIPLIEKMAPKADKILVGGLLAFTFIEAQKDLGLKTPEIYNSSASVQPDFVEIAKDILEKYPNKIILPVDFVYQEDGEKKYAFDIGEKTMKLYKESLKDSKTIFWNGPLGYYEKEPYDKGTKELAHYLTTLEAFTALGGGDIVSAVGQIDKDKISFISMGGGASLDYLSR